MPRCSADAARDRDRPRQVRAEWAEQQQRDCRFDHQRRAREHAAQRRVRGQQRSEAPAPVAVADRLIDGGPFPPALAALGDEGQQIDEGDLDLQRPEREGRDGRRRRAAAQPHVQAVRRAAVDEERPEHQRLQDGVAAVADVRCCGCAADTRNNHSNSVRDARAVAERERERERKPGEEQGQRGAPTAGQREQRPGERAEALGRPGHQAVQRVEGVEVAQPIAEVGEREQPERDPQQRRRPRVDDAAPECPSENVFRAVVHTAHRTQYGMQSNAVHVSNFIALTAIFARP